MSSPSSGKPQVILVVPGKEEKTKALATEIKDLVGTKKYLVYSATFKSLASDPWQGETVLLVLGQKLPKHLASTVEDWVQNGGKLLDFDGSNLEPQNLSVLLQNIGVELAKETGDVASHPLDSLVSTIKKFIETLPGADLPDAAGLSSKAIEDMDLTATHVLVLDRDQTLEFDSSKYKQALASRELGKVALILVLILG